MNNSSKYIFFDTETTGLFKRTANGSQVKDMAIWNLAYRDVDSGMHKNIIADIGGVKFQPGALNVYGSDITEDALRGKIPSVYAGYLSGNPGIIKTEKELLQEFGSMLIKNPGKVLAGYNIKGFDIPLIAEKFKQHGLENELSALKNMSTMDVLEKSKAFLHTALPEKIRKHFNPLGQITDGVKLDMMAEAFGISTVKGMSHLADVDAQVAEELNKILDNPDEAARRYSLSRHAHARDTYEKIQRTVDPNREIATWEDALDEIKKTNNLTDASLNAEIESNIRNWNPTSYSGTSVKSILDNQPVNIDATASSTVNTPLRKAIDSIKEETGNVITSGTRNVSANFDNAIKKSKDFFTPKNVGIGLAVIGAGLIYKAISPGSSNDRDAYISATNLGKDPKEMINESRLTKGKSLKQDIGKNPIADIGTQIHTIIEEEFNQKGFSYDSEVPVYDDELKIQGRIDILGKLNGQKIPIEVKSISSERFAGLTEPDYAYASQANFYAHASNAPGAYVLYVDAENLKRRKAFYVPYSPERIIRDVADIRSALIESGQGGYTKKWLMQMEDFFQNSPIPSGVRSSDSSQSSYNGFEEIKPHPEHDFPGGRTQFFKKSIAPIKSSIKNFTANTEEILKSSIPATNKVAKEVNIPPLNEVRVKRIMPATGSSVGMPMPKHNLFGAINRSKIQDQATKNSHLFPIGTPNGGNATVNASRYNQRSSI